MVQVTGCPSNRSNKRRRGHAVIEFIDGGFQVRDLGSTNGVVVNGKAVKSARIQHGDRIEIGGQILQFICDERDQDPEIYELP